MDAGTYYQSLIEQGYDAGTALSYTHNHFPDFMPPIEAAPVQVTQAVTPTPVAVSPPMAQSVSQQSQFTQPAPQPMVMGEVSQHHAQQAFAPGVMVVTGQKSKLVTFLLAFFFGVFGIHNFYLGKNGLGIIQLLLTILTFGIGAFITAPWALIEGILALASPTYTDANGVPLI